MKRAVLGVLTALVIVAAGCGDAKGPDADASLYGTYTLRTVNGSPLPFTVFELGSDRVEFLDARLTLKRGDTWETWAKIRLTQGPTVTTDEDSGGGTFTRTGNTLTLRDADGDEFVVVVSGSRLTTTDGGYTFVFEK
jgi:hypothetical protein